MFEDFDIILGSITYMNHSESIKVLYAISILCYLVLRIATKDPFNEIVCRENFAPFVRALLEAHLFRCWDKLSA